MIGHKRVPSREGGVEIVVEELAERMVESGHEVTCYNRSGHHVSGKGFDGQPEKEYRGIKLKRVITIDKKGLAAVSSSFFASLAAAFGKYDIVHFHAEGPCAMLWIPKLFGKRCIATIHGLDWKREKWQGSFASKYIKLGERIAVRYADEIIVLSKSVQKYFSDTYGRKTTFIPNGVNKPQIREADQIKRFGLEKDSYILFLGRIVPEKGLRYLLNAYMTMDTDKKLVIAGGSSDTEYFLSELQKKSLKCVDEQGNNKISFVGFVQDRLLEELYSNAYLYVLPSDVEGMPLGLLEAMSYGNCCLVSDIEECSSVVGDRGITFQRGNTADLRSKLTMLCGNEKLVRKYKSKSADFVGQKYSWDNIVNQTLQIYAQVLLTEGCRK